MRQREQIEGWTSQQSTNKKQYLQQLQQSQQSQQSTNNYKRAIATALYKQQKYSKVGLDGQG